MPSSVTDLGGRKVGTDDFLAAVLGTIAQPIWVVDADGLIRFANPAAISALGYRSAEELVGRPSHETIHHRRPDGTPYPASECPMLLPRTTGETIARDLDWFFRRDGSMLPVAYVSAPIDFAEGRGAVVAFTNIEDRMRAEEALVARDALLGDQQAALRRLATLVAGGAGAADVFASIAREVARVLHVPLVTVSRYEPDAPATVIGSSSERSAPAADGARASAVIVVEGVAWGEVAAHPSEGEPLPDGVDARLSEFTELVGTAIASSHAREGLARLADEQAALRRVATLVAEGPPPDDVFAAVAAEIGRLAGAQMVLVSRDERDGTATVVGAWGDHPLEAGAHWTLEGASISRTVLETGRSARTEAAPDGPGAIADVARSLGVHSRVGVPIVVDGEVWGVIAAGAAGRQPLPPGIEGRLEQFTELIATAISNTQARAQLRELAEEQAALRRVATLVAAGAVEQDVWDAVCVETGRLLGALTTNLIRYIGDDVNETVAGWSVRGVHVPPGTRVPLVGDTIDTLVWRTAAPSRFDSYESGTGRLAAMIRELGIRSEVGAPVVVEGRVWGALIAGTDEPQPLPAGTEVRLASFAELVATAISNANARSELIASRARIAQAADEQRRRVVRDLHDGAQQRLVQLVLTLQLVRDRDDVPPEVEALHEEIIEQTRLAVQDLRELAHGIHPSVLTHHGLAAAVDDLAQRAPLPVEVAIPEARYVADVESAAYFVVAESLTNVAKYAHASFAEVEAGEAHGRLVLVIHDDGAGGASARPGSGLAGLQDRMAALGGRLTIDSSSDRGTTIRAEIPCRDRPRIN